MILEVKDITKKFGDNEVLHGVSFQVESGKALGLLGRNGAGKTTTIRIIMDVFRANSGELYLDGRKFNQKDVQIGYLPEERGLYPKKTVIEQLIYLAKLRGLSKKQAEENAKFWLKRLEVDQYTKKTLETLSKGNQQKVQLAKWLFAKPKVLILDEPTRGIDVGAKYEIYTLMNRLVEEGMSIIMISSELPEVLGMSDRLYVMSGGSITGELSAEEADERKVMAMAVRS